MSNLAATPAQARTYRRSRSDRILAVRRFFRTLFSRKIVIFGFAGTLFFVLVALFAPVIATQDPNALTMPPPSIGSGRTISAGISLPGWYTGRAFPC